MEWLIYVSGCWLVFNAGFVVGCWWASRGRDEDELRRVAVVNGRPGLRVMP
jgi:hypothetical protein